MNDIPTESWIHFRENFLLGRVNLNFMSITFDDESYRLIVKTANDITPNMIDDNQGWTIDE